MRSKIGICNGRTDIAGGIEGCKKLRPIENRKYNLCPSCNKKRRGVQPKKKRSKPEFWKSIWDNRRPHRCIVTGKPVEFLTHTFSHIVSVSQNKSLEFVEENVQYMTFKAHEQWEHCNKDEDGELRRDKKFNTTFEIYDRLIKRTS